MFGFLQLTKIEFRDRVVKVQDWPLGRVEFDGSIRRSSDTGPSLTTRLNNRPFGIRGEQPWIKVDGSRIRVAGFIGSTGLLKHKP